MTDISRRPRTAQAEDENDGASRNEEKVPVPPDMTVYESGK